MAERPAGGDSRPPHRATRQDVADHAGVSAGVVSYVINGGPRPVAEATRKRILEAIEILNYRPNASARALALARSDTIGLLVPDMRNPFYSEFAFHIKESAAGRGRAVLIGNTGLDPESEAAQIETVLARQIDGIVAFGIRDAQSRERLETSGVPLVSMDWQFQDRSTPTVVADDYAAARAAIEHLLWHGHRSIAYVGGPTDLEISAARRRAWSDAMSFASSDELTRLERSSEYTHRGGYQAAAALMSQEDPPSALFVGSDVQAFGAIRALFDLGLSVPGDVALVSFDGTEESLYSVPSLTAVRLPLQGMAELAVARLLDESPDSALHRTVAHELVIRESCGCPTVTSL